MHSFSIIPVIALLCYIFLLLSLVTAKKNPQIRGFMALLIAMIMWTGASWLMRLDFWPSVEVWFQVSLTGLLMIPVTLFIFLRRFMEVQKTYHVYFWAALITILLLINYVTEFFLKAPALVRSAAGEAYIYTFTWPVAFLFIGVAGAFAECARMAFENNGKNAFLRKQLRPIWLGLIIMAAGNALLLIPAFKSFPIDICSGIPMAACMYYALYTKRLFRLNALASKASCYSAAFLIAMALFYRIIPDFENLLRRYFTVTETEITMAVSFTVMVATILIYMLLKFLLDRVFEKEENIQSKCIVEFSEKVSYLMSLQEILLELARVIEDAISSEHVYIFLKDEKGDYQLKLSNMEEAAGHCIPAFNQLVRLLKDAGGHMLEKEYTSTAYYRNLDEGDKQVLSKHQIQCAVGIGDKQDFTGIILMSAKGSGHRYTQKDLNFLTSLNSVASIAIKNSQLYEAACDEARRDYLTGVANRKYFYEMLQLCCEQKEYAFGTLLIINVDDFKLYNQLYGDEEGDEALKRIAAIIRAEAKEACIVARYSGKEFALLLPECDTQDAKALAERISLRIREMNHGPAKKGEYAMKALTVSCGIAKGICPMENYHDLINQANMAVYYAKQAGKNRVMIYKEGQGNSEEKYSELAYQPGTYSDYASTIYALTAAIDAKDHYTFSHSENVAYYSRELAKAYGMNEEGINIVYEAGLLHDIGKIGINEEILNKPGKLTEDEYEIMKSHVSLSIGIIRHLPSLDYVIPAVIGHHERYDAKGYPRGIGGSDIPLMARILGIADSFDAMVSERSYKAKMDVEKALGILEEEAGKQFDPQLVPIFVKLVRDGIIEVK